MEQWTPTAPAFPAPPDPVNVLLVDDQATYLGALKATLEVTGCQFVLAKSGDDALRALLDQDFAAIVLDVHLADMDGFELAAMIKRRERNQNVPILFLTGQMMDEADALQGYARGAVDYLLKPVKPEILRAKISVFAELYRSRRALARLNVELRRQITERQRAEEALRQANRELESRVQERTAAGRQADSQRNDFLATVAQELRHPLSALSAEFAGLRQRVPHDSELDKAVNTIKWQLSYLTRLTDDLRDVSRITLDKLTLHRERVDLREVLMAAVETAQPSVRPREITLTVDLPAGGIWVNGDSVRLSQVFVNLLENAASFTPSRGQIRLSAEVGTTWVAVRVKDNGAGIDREVLPRIFDLFVQGAPRQNARGGLGIGLHLVRRLTHLHGGSVDAYSDGPGKGAEFEVRLPLATEEAAH